MPITRWFIAALCVLPIVPAAAQTVGTKSAAQASPADIVVEGVVDEKSVWKRAESAHVIVTSKGSDAELKRVTDNLERLYYLMSRVYRRADKPDDTVKLQVTLVDSGNFFTAMRLQNLRSQEGPFATTFAGARYYDPREDGEVLAVPRTDQVVDLNTAFAADRDFLDKLDSGDGGGNLLSGPEYHPPIARAWEALLYSAFAQHFLLTYLPAAYPRWYLDGVGAVFSTMKVRRDGTIDYARSPENYGKVFQAYGDVHVAEVLTGKYLDLPPGKTYWTPYHAWLMTHYFIFSQLRPDRAAQFQHYMTAIHQGVPMAEAAKAFGDLRKLQREINTYGLNHTAFARAEASQTLGGDPVINTLTRSSAALIEARIELDSRTAALPGGADADWLTQVRATVAPLPYNADAVLTEAEAECRSTHYAECLAAAERVLARTPDNVRALAWKGTAQMHQALAGPVAARAAGLADARATIAHALRIDGDAPLALIAAFQSYAAAGERVPDTAVLGMAKVIRLIPAAPGPRLYLAAELLRQGQSDLARRVLSPVLYGGYDSPERTAAKALFPSTGVVAQAGQ